MKNLLGIINLLKRFGIYIYTGDRRDDIDFMTAEIKELYENGLIGKDDYLKAILILRNELAKLGTKN